MSKLLPWIAVLLCLAFIFALSHQPAAVSNHLSTGITEVVVKYIEKVAPRAEFDAISVNRAIRKMAHFAAYFALALLLMFTLGRRGMCVDRAAGLTLLLCVLYAALDEFHQLYVPGRGAQVKDVLIDGAGAGAVILLYTVIGRLRHRAHSD